MSGSRRLRCDFGHGALGFGDIGRMRDVHAILFALATPAAAAAATAATLFSFTGGPRILLGGSGGSSRRSRG